MTSLWLDHTRCAYWIDECRADNIRIKRAAHRHHLFSGNNKMIVFQSILLTNETSLNAGEPKQNRIDSRFLRIFGSLGFAKVWDSLISMYTQLHCNMSTFGLCTLVRMLTSCSLNFGSIWICDCVCDFIRAVHSTIFFLSRIVNLLLSGRVYIWLLSVSHHRREESEVFEWTTHTYVPTTKQQRKKKFGASEPSSFIWADFDALCGFSLVLLHGLISLLFIADAELWFVNSSCNDMASCFCIALLYVRWYFCHPFFVPCSRSVSVCVPFTPAPSLSIHCTVGCTTVENVHVNHYDSTNIKLDYVVHS